MVEERRKQTGFFFFYHKKLRCCNKVVTKECPHILQVHRRRPFEAEGKKRQTDRHRWMIFPRDSWRFGVVVGILTIFPGKGEKAGGGGRVVVAEGAYPSLSSIHTFPY